ncbi:metal ABC transporter ATP-binding protein [Pantoea sp. FN0305]|uniref:metal ABC transporter ATP-binding protein n=1 Tax=Pantoea sp. FN0305 TaxID=3418559 RepID=UPI003CFA0B38
MGCHSMGGRHRMITLEKLVTGYRGEALSQPISGQFRRGSLTAIMGVNGAGKSTLLKTIAGLLTPVSGAVRFEPEGRQIAWLPQQSEIDHHFPLRVIEVVAMGSWPANGMLRGIGCSLHERIETALEQVGLLDLAGRAISQLSGGQFQRMLFARMLVQDASVILLDEPFTGIDSQTSTFLLRVIERLHAEGKTILTVLHNQHMVEHHFPQLLYLHDGHYHWGKTADIMPENAGRPLSLVRSAVGQGLRL